MLTNYLLKSKEGSKMYVSKNIFLIKNLHCVKVKIKEKNITVGDCVKPLPSSLSECKQIMQ